MATDNPVFELVDTYTYLGQEMKNVYFYQRGSALGFNAQDLCEDWIDQVLPQVVDCQPSAVVHTAVRARNLFDVADNGEVLHSVAGGLSSPGEGLMPFVAASFNLARETAITRSGKKRLYVGGESHQTDGVWTSGLMAELTTLAGLFASKLVVTLVERWFPVIVKRIFISEGKYRLPENLTEAVVNPIVDATASSLVTTQNSRKVGVGS